MANIFHDPTKALPKKDAQIIRAPFEQQELGGRSSHIPKIGKSPYTGIDHLPNRSTKD